MRRGTLQTIIGAAVAVMLSLPTASSAGDKNRFEQILRAQSLYEEVLRLRAAGVAGYDLAAPYTAPLPGTTGPSYLWGGVDVIEVIKTYDHKIDTDPGRVVFIDRDGDELGSEAFALRVPAYRGQPEAQWPTALFQSQENLETFQRMTGNGSLLVAFGLNCQWGIISGPQSARSDKPKQSHWAQPGLGAINVERFFGGRVTVLGMNLYLRGDDWNATKHRWKFAVEAFEQLLSDPAAWRARRERPELPIIQVHE